MYQVLDIFFLLFHTLLIFFNLFGWITKITRKANLIVLLLTGASWFILGIFYGIGYCPLTDWHWQVLVELGETNIPNSYISYITHRVFSIDPPGRFVDTATGIFYFLALAVSIYVNVKDCTKRPGL